jgi:imidazole glycerol-phosphate synthase subunit HisH
MPQTLAIIDYGMGNLHSVASAVHAVAPDVQVEITGDPAAIAAADRVIFPGVGAMRDCMAEILRLNIHTSLQAQIASGKPLLAICVGMQALLERSEENGGVACLGHFAGEVKSFSQTPAFQAANQGAAKLKVPHMGWNPVEQTRAHPLWAGIDNRSRFYFVHSFYVQTPDAQSVLGTSEHGIAFVAAMAHKNVFAVQFHPEKSHTAGLQLLNNFIHWQP